MCMKRYDTRIGEFYRIGQQIEQNLSNARLVAPNFGHLVGEITPKLNRLIIHETHPRSHHPLENFVHIGFGKVERKLARLDFAQVKNILDESQEMLPVLLNQTHIIAENLW